MRRTMGLGIPLIVATLVIAGVSWWLIFRSGPTADDLICTAHIDDGAYARIHFGMGVRDVENVLGGPCGNYGVGRCYLEDGTTIDASSDLLNVGNFGTGSEGVCVVTGVTQTWLGTTYAIQVRYNVSMEVSGKALAPISRKK